MRTSIALDKRAPLLIGLCCWAGFGFAADTGPAAAPAAPSIQLAFTPHEQADAMLVEAIRRARQSILVQAYTFSYRKFTAALIEAQSRGVDVVMVADRTETLRQVNGEIAALAAARVPVYLDGQHDASHNKVMVFDAGTANCAVATGSYNFSYAAQHRNAENLLILRGDVALCERYRRNWDLHRAHSLRYRR